MFLSCWFPEFLCLCTFCHFFPISVLNELSCGSFEFGREVAIAKLLHPSKLCESWWRKLIQILLLTLLLLPPCAHTAESLAAKNTSRSGAGEARWVLRWAESVPISAAGCICLLTTVPPLSLRRLTGNEPLTILPLTSEMEEAAVKAHYKVCDRLKLEKKQRRMCRRDPGVAETLMEAISMSALECQYQFRFERWNCTLEGRYRASLLKRGEWDRGLVGLAGTSCTQYFPLWCLLVHPVPLVGGHLPRGPTKVCRR